MAATEISLSTVMSLFLALSQGLTRPESFKTHFDPVNDQKLVLEIMRNGCKEIERKNPRFSIDGMGEFIDAFLLGLNAKKQPTQIMPGFDLSDGKKAFDSICVNTTGPASGFEIEKTISFYNAALENIPRAVDEIREKKRKMNQATFVYDANGERFSEMYNGNGRRRWIPIDEIPVAVRNAFVAAEDQNFYKHKGFESSGFARAMVMDLAKMLGKAQQKGTEQKFDANATDEKKAKDLMDLVGRPEGGSTISQQVIKNIVVGDQVSLQRKIREIALTAEIEASGDKSRMLSKDEILELYLNYIPLGIASWGVDMSARSFFGYSIKDPRLTVAQAAAIAALAKGSTDYAPLPGNEKAVGRRQYVLKQMLEQKFISKDQFDKAMAEKVVANDFKTPRQRRAFYFLDDLKRSATAALKVDSIDDMTLDIKSTIHPQLQALTEAALQEGLNLYEEGFNRIEWTGPELNLADRMQKIGKLKSQSTDSPLWLQALKRTKPVLYDLHWPLAVVTKTNRESVHVGLSDGNEYQLVAWDEEVLGSLRQWDVVHVRVVKDKKDKSGRVYASLRFRSKVQGAALVLENGTGRILSMVGGFSYPLSQFNRAGTGTSPKTNMFRQPGSTFKPVVYLSMLNRGYQPNTLVATTPSEFQLNEPGARVFSPEGSDKNIGPLTLRRCLEKSNNFCTANLLRYIGTDPTHSIDIIAKTSEEVGLYEDALSNRYFPLIIGSKDARMIDVARFFATIANGGRRPVPHSILSISRNGKPLFPTSGDNAPALAQVDPTFADSVAFYQLRRMLQGVLRNGTARSLSDLAEVMGGKTGTTNNSRDVWFAGFTNDITIVTWVGYDNKGEKRTLGGSEATAAKITLPIVERIVRGYARATGKELKPLTPPPTELNSLLVKRTFDSSDGTPADANGPFDYFRVSTKGILDTRTALIGTNYQHRYERSDDDNSNDETRKYRDRNYTQPRPTKRYRPFEDDGSRYYDGPAEDENDVWISRSRRRR